jgi:hypothetical protein
MVNNTTYVPVNEYVGMFKELGFYVNSSDGANYKIIDDKNTIEVKQHNPTTYSVNKSEVWDAKPVYYYGVTYLPLRSVVVNIGAAMSWDSANNMAHVSYNGKDSYIAVNKYYLQQMADIRAKRKVIVESNLTPFLTLAKVAVLENLKYPNTATFSDVHYAEYRDYTFQDFVIIRGYVKAQTGLGLMKESPFEVFIKFDTENGKATNYKVDAVYID